MEVSIFCASVRLRHLGYVEIDRVLRLCGINLMIKITIERAMETWMRFVIILFLGVLRDGVQIRHGILFLCFTYFLWIQMTWNFNRFVSILRNVCNILFIITVTFPIVFKDFVLSLLSVIECSVNSIGVFFKSKHITKSINARMLLESVSVRNLVLLFLLFKLPLTELAFKHKGHVEQQDNGNLWDKDISHLEGCLPT